MRWSSPCEMELSVAGRRGEMELSDGVRVSRPSWWCSPCQQAVVVRWSFPCEMELSVSAGRRGEMELSVSAGRRGEMELSV